MNKLHMIRKESQRNDEAEGRTTTKSIEEKKAIWETGKSKVLRVGANYLEDE